MHTTDRTYRVFVRTYGCQMNEYDSTRLLHGLAAHAKVEVCSKIEDANLLIMNTCSVRAKAVQKMLSELGVWRGYKKKRPNTLIAVGGCVASHEGEAILKRAPHVDVVFGPRSFSLLPSMLASVGSVGAKRVALDLLESEKFDALPPHILSADKGIHSYVSIMEGCGKHCTYCIVPHTRGPEYYRPVASIIMEIQSLVVQGMRAVTLLGQNVNAWRGTWQGKDVDFAWLLHLINALPDITKISFTTSHPLEMTSRLVACYGSLEKLAPELHLPVQSGSDRILRLMKRGYRVKEYIKIIEAIRERLPRVVVTTDFIVGYPGETETDFMETMNLSQYIGFARAYCYLYSPRPHTPASDVIDTTPKEVLKDRLRRLQSLFKTPTVIPIHAA